MLCMSSSVDKMRVERWQLKKKRKESNGVVFRLSTEIMMRGEA